MTATTQTTAAESVPLDIKSTATHYQPSFPAPAVPVIPKTVDYGHGHGMSSVLYLFFFCFQIMFWIYTDEHLIF